MTCGTRHFRTVSSPVCVCVWSVVSCVWIESVLMAIVPAAFPLRYKYNVTLFSVYTIWQFCFFEYKHTLKNTLLNYNIVLGDPISVQRSKDVIHSVFLFKIEGCQKAVRFRSKKHRLLMWVCITAELVCCKPNVNAWVPVLSLQQTCTWGHKIYFQSLFPTAWHQFFSTLTNSSLPILEHRWHGGKGSFCRVKLCSNILWLQINFVLND